MASVGGTQAPGPGDEPPRPFKVKIKLGGNRATASPVSGDAAAVAASGVEQPAAPPRKLKLKVASGAAISSVSVGGTAFASAVETTVVNAAILTPAATQAPPPLKARKASRKSSTMGGLDYDPSAALTLKRHRSSKGKKRQRDGLDDEGAYDEDASPVASEAEEDEVFSDIARRARVTAKAGAFGQEFIEGGEDDLEDFSSDEYDDDLDEDDEGGLPGRRSARSGSKRGGSSRGKGDSDRKGFGRAMVPRGARLGLGATNYGADGQLAEVDCNFTWLQLKPDHQNRPLWATPDGRIFLETFSNIYKQAYDFLIAIAEPVCRPECVHEYQLTPHSLYAAVSVGLETETIISVLNRLSKVQMSEDTKAFIRSSTQNYGKVKLVLKRNRFYVESHDRAVLRTLLNDPVIAKAHVQAEGGGDSLIVSWALKDKAAAHIARVQHADFNKRDDEDDEMAAAATIAATGVSHGAGAAAAAGGGTGPGAAVHADAGGPSALDFGGQGEEDREREVVAFEIAPEQVEHVKQRCLPGGLNYPMLEEYDFKNDAVNADLNMELKPHVKLRPYQEKSLSKMFGNGRARSGIIVLPCGAGKSLVGVAAAARVRKSCLCLCTSSVSVDQWRHQFKLWTSLQESQVSRFTSDQKEQFAGVAGVTITTFTMVAFSGKRSAESERVMKEIQSREWGLLLLDEVHVVPAQMFRKVISIVHAHCKLGLTATLVREDELIGDLNFLIGPKLYEANWLDLTRAGHIANVQCAEVWCPMTAEFFREYLKKENSARKQLTYVMNPNKFMACQFLIEYHERHRGDKVIVFSDNIWALKEYAMKLGKPFIYGPTSHAERTRVLHAFKHDPNVNTVFLSKVGDNSLDIPEANVLIQISSHAGSRRQEAQRLGRILRAKRGVAGSGAEGDFNAFFYTLVSTDTQEMYYSAKRQQFLIDQGYSFKVVTNLLEAARESALTPYHYSTQKEQMDLLARVLTTGLEEAGIENVDDADADQLAARSKPAAKRFTGNMAAISGGQGLRYMEFKSGGRGGGRGGKPGYQTDKAKAMGKKLLGPTAPSKGLNDI